MKKVVALAFSALTASLIGNEPQHKIPPIAPAVPSQEAAPVISEGKTENLAGKIGAKPGKKSKKIVSSEKALANLKKGNVRYLAGELRTDGVDGMVRERLKDKEKPHSVVISCSDSRVAPELVFDQRLGEIFTIRVAGQVLDPSVLASTEYAVEQLGVRNIFVMGHTSCGFVKTALSTKEGTSAGSEHLDALIADIRPRLNKGRGLASEPSANVVKESAANAEGIASEIPKKSSLLKKAVESGKVQIHWGLYHLDTGVVDFH